MAWRVFIYLILALGQIGATYGDVYRIYLDADHTHHRESAMSIEQGIRTALAEIDNRIADHTLELFSLDHRGNTIRSKQNYQRFLNDPRGLVVFSGIHSPPLIKNRAFINENQALTLVPWAAGGPITRYPTGTNWIFRLSVDDARAGHTIVDFALRKKRCQAVHLFLEDTLWGDSNLKTMNHALQDAGKQTHGVTRFDWSLREARARIALRKILRDGADCVILVANSVEGQAVANAMASFAAADRRPIISHWGITAGDFHRRVQADVRRRLDLHFIQTCFAFTRRPLTPFARAALRRAQGLFPDQITRPEDIRAPAGFIHAYDLTRLLIHGLKQIELSGAPRRDREALRDALEALPDPTQGLIKTYHRPFGPFHPVTARNAHEALSGDDFCMAFYGDRDQIHVLAP